MLNSAAIAAESAGLSGHRTGQTRHGLQAAVEFLANITEAFTAALFLRDQQGESLYPAAWHTLGRSFRSDRPIRLGEGLVGYVAKHQTPVDVDRYQQSSEATGLYAADEGIKAFVGVPVGELGVLVVDTKTRQVFGEREKKTIRDFGLFLAQMVLQQETCAREALYGRILDLMYDVENAALNFAERRSFYAEILDAGRRFTGLAMSFLCLLHPGRKQFVVEAVEGPSVSTLRGRSFPVSQGLVGWVLREGRPLTNCRIRTQQSKSYLITPDEPVRGYNAFVGVPLSAWRHLMGVWAFAGHTERVIDEEEERALQLAGHRLAATLEHYRLAPQ
ncbi:MAG: GAF domain-containing protein [Thermodesulfobacteriota bacterium]